MSRHELLVAIYEYASLSMDGAGVPSKFLLIFAFASGLMSDALGVLNWYGAPPTFTEVVIGIGAGVKLASLDNVAER